MADENPKDVLAMPGFKALSDEAKRKVMVTKFPSFAKLSPLAQNKVLGLKESSFGERALKATVGGLEGVGQGALETLRGIGETGMRGFGGQVPLRTESRAKVEELEKPKTTSQTVGKFGERVAEFALPEAGGLRLERAAGLTGKAAVKALGQRMATEGAKTGVITGAQTGGNLKEMGKSAAVGAAFPVLGATSRLVGRYATDLLGISTGVGGEVIRTALNHANEKLWSAMRGGIDEIQIAQDVRDAVGKVADARSAAYRRELAALPNKAINIDPVKTDLLKTLRSEYNIPARRKLVKTATGWAPGQLELDFSHSTISNGADQNRILSLVTDLDNWKQNSTAGVDILKRRVDNLYREAGSDRAVVQNTKDHIRRLLNKEVPGYEKMTKDYAQASKFLDEITREFSVHGGTGTLVRKVFPNALNQNNEYRKIMIEALDQAAGSDLKSEIAGGALRSLMPRGLVARGFLGGTMMMAEHMLGRSSPEQAAVAFVDLLASSPKAVGMTMALISALKRNPVIRGGTALAGQAARGAGLASLPQLGGGQEQPQQ